MSKDEQPAPPPLQVTLTFTPEHLNDRETRGAAMRALKADEAFRALSDVRDELFHPVSRGHGYRPPSRLAKLYEELEKHKITIAGEEETTLGYAFVDALLDEFNDILRERGLDLDEE